MEGRTAGCGPLVTRVRSPEAEGPGAGGGAGDPEAMADARASSTWAIHSTVSGFRMGIRRLATSRSAAEPVEISRVGHFTEWTPWTRAIRLQPTCGPPAVAHHPWWPGRSPDSIPSRAMHRPTPPPSSHFANQGPRGLRRRAGPGARSSGVDFSSHDRAERPEDGSGDAWRLWDMAIRAT